MDEADEADFTEAMRSVRQKQEAEDARARSESTNDATSLVSKEYLIPLCHSHTFVAECDCRHSTQL